MVPWWVAIRHNQLITSRVLYLDDSGKPDAGHQSKAVVIGGIAIDSDKYATFARRIAGAKAKFFKYRGTPHSWELKSDQLVKKINTKKMAFCNEVIQIAGGVNATIFSVSILKANLFAPMDLKTSMPLQLQALADHFAAECGHMGRTGIIVSDWSGPAEDEHASRCVASHVAKYKLPIHPAVYYASSMACEAVQVADLIAGTRRRVIEGDVGLKTLDAGFAAVQATTAKLSTARGRAFSNKVALF